jgi:hypothetical protein
MDSFNIHFVVQYMLIIGDPTVTVITKIRQPMFKLRAHSGFHELLRFRYVKEYKYGSIPWLEDGNLYLRLRTMLQVVL